ncbi:MAG: DUF4175 family protein, partial [Opitutae bacterium]
MKKSILGFSSAIMLIATIVHAQRSDVLQTTERIRSEERRQVEVRRQIGGASRQIESLLLDLQSNGLYEAAKGPVIKGMKDSLDTVNAQRVPKAAEELQQARLQIEEDAFSHLDEANKEITLIIEDLDQLLRATESALIGDILLERIREIIKTESFIRRETAKWGKLLFVNADAAAADKPRVIRAQNENIQQLNQFKSLLSGAVIDAVDDSLVKRFGAAQKIVLTKKPDVLLQNAIATIGQEDAISTVGHQDSAIEVLKEIESILASEDDDISNKAEVLEELKRILQAQIDLKEETQDEPKARPDPSELQAEQLQLKKELEEAVSGEPESTPLNNAADAMQEAANQLGDGRLPDAVEPQETAISNLQNAISDLEAQIAAEAADAASDSFSDPMDSFGDAFADPM